jgi:ADP-ribose pyrophosphatase YjhB (NUDIX family)
MESAARRACVREVEEETGLSIDPGDMVYFSQWITPEESPKRYDTWFFIAACKQTAVRVDGSEIREYKWFEPSEALGSQRAGDIQLMPPTFVTLQELSRFDTAENVLEYYRMRPPACFLPRIAMVPGGVCSLYQGDAGYETRDPDTPGPRHRFWMMDKGWRYEKS